MSVQHPGRRVDVVTAVVLAALGIAAGVEGVHLGLVGQFGPGPGLLPMLLGFALVAAALVLGLKAVVSGGSLKGVALSNTRGLGQVGLVIGALVVTAFVFVPLGFPLTVGLLTFFIVYVITRRKPVQSAAVAVAVAAVGYGLFSLLLRVPLPTGPLPIPGG